MFERQQRGAWHAHVVVVTKEDIRTGTDAVGLNQLLKDKRDRKISKAIYYSGIKRLASPNLQSRLERVPPVVRHWANSRPGGRRKGRVITSLMPAICCRSSARHRRWRFMFQNTFPRVLNIAGQRTRACGWWAAPAMCHGLQ